MILDLALERTGHKLPDTDLDRRRVGQGAGTVI
jgi:hypothetical protein